MLHAGSGAQPPDVRLSCMSLHERCAAPAFFGTPTLPYLAQVPTPIGYVPLPYPPNSVAYYTLLAVVIPLGVVVPVAWLVFPSPAGRQVRFTVEPSGGNGCGALQPQTDGGFQLTMADDLPLFVAGPRRHVPRAAQPGPDRRRRD